MKRTNFDSMSIDELWTLQNGVAETLATKIANEKTILEKRLSHLTQQLQTVRPRSRRPYPRVLPKYLNPDAPSQTWSGRGKQPRWLTAQLRSGKRVEDFLILTKNAASAVDN
jgi:DNA-binding protein H-NS